LLAAYQAIANQLLNYLVNPSGGTSFQGCAFVTRAADRNGGKSPLALALLGGDSDLRRLTALKAEQQAQTKTKEQRAILKLFHYTLKRNPV
jgi:hypothetical protein